MTNEIRPALSAEEWKGSTADVLDGYVDLDTGTVDVRLGGAGSQSRSQHDDAWALVALLNDSLPDDDTRKFTWEDVERVNIAGGMASRAGAVTVAENLFILATKLAALLPPQEEGVAR